ncbi:MAG: cytochrome c [Steroidobacteraceae bacterium]|nr:cytochrome c [Steroidobacteraceae bacterium]
MDLRSIVAVVGAMLATACVAANSPPVAPPASPVANNDGQVLYGKHCLTCHQADGYGVPNLQPAIVGGTWVGGDARALAMFVLTGGFDSASRKDGENHNVMPSFARLSDEDLAAILTFIRGKFGKGAPAVSAADVADARKNLPLPQ